MDHSPENTPPAVLVELPSAGSRSRPGIRQVEDKMGQPVYVGGPSSPSRRGFLKRITTAALVVAAALGYKSEVDTITRNSTASLNNPNINPQFKASSSDAEPSQVVHSPGPANLGTDSLANYPLPTDQRK